MATEFAGLTTCNPEEKTRLHHFVDTELRPYEETRETSTLVQHRIRLRETKPIKHRSTPRNLEMQAIINQEVDKMLTEDIIEPSNNPWSSQIVLVRKRDERYRFCVDCRRLSQVSIKDAYPLPQINTTLDKNSLRQGIYPALT